MFKYYIFCGLLSLFCAAIVVVGFTIIGSPNEQKLIKLDQTRIANFSNIHDEILVYYQKNFMFPKTLKDLTISDSVTNLTINDPETDKPYEFQVLNGYQYKLCTDFSTDSTQVKKDSTDYYTYGYNIRQDAVSLNHKKGHDCITLQIPNSYTQLKYDENSYKNSLMPNDKKQSATVSLKSLDKIGECEWKASLVLQGFAPYTTFYVTSAGNISENCDAAQTHPYSWTAGPGGYSDGNGNTVFVYDQKDYGDYTYTVTDLKGNSSSIHFSYDKNSKEPKIIPTTKTAPIPQTPAISPTATP